MSTKSYENNEFSKFSNKSTNKNQNQEEPSRRNIQKARETAINQARRVKTSIRYA